MARQRFNHNTFSTGFLSKKVQGNTDFEMYNNALDVCENFLVQCTGGCFKRAGTRFVGTTKNNDQAKLIPFVYSDLESYVLEIGNKYIRFFNMSGQVKENNQPYEISTPFLWENLSTIQYFQYGRILYILYIDDENKSENEFKGGIYTLELFEDGTFQLRYPKNYTIPPFTFCNDESIALKASGDPSSSIIEFVSVNAQNKTEKPNIQYAPVFYDADKGGILLVSTLDKSNVEKKYYFNIEEVLEDGYTDFNKIRVSLNKELSYKDEDGVVRFPFEEYQTRWSVSAFNKDRGMPKCMTLFESRLFLSTNRTYPLGLWGSSLMYDDFYDFLPGAEAADALQIKANIERSNDIIWLVGTSKLFLGTTNGIYVAGSVSARFEDILTPANFRIKVCTFVGTKRIIPLKAMEVLFYVDASGKNVHELVLDNDTLSFKSNDLSLIANDLTQSGIVEHAWCQNPSHTYWCTVQDGYLCALTYLKNNGILAWSKHTIAGTNAYVESITSITGEHGDYLWLIVRREIAGEIVRYVEVLEQIFDASTDNFFKQYYVDSGKTKSERIAILAINKNKTAHVNCDMTSISVNGEYPSKIKILTGIYNEQGYLIEDKFAVNTAINITDTGFDWRDFDEDYSIYSNTPPPIDANRDPKQNGKLSIYTFVGESHSIRTGNVGEISPIYIESEGLLLQNGASVRLQNSGIEVEIQNQVLSLDDIKCYVKSSSASGFFITTRSGNNFKIVSKVEEETTEIYKRLKIVSLQDVNFGTNMSIDTNSEFAKEEGELYLTDIRGSGNNRKYLFKKIGTNKYALYYKENKYIGIESWPAYEPVREGFGFLYRYFSGEEKVISGLGHLEGETVSVCADGNDRGKFVVKDGQIRLKHKFFYASVGLPYTARLKTVPFSGGSMLGSSVGSIGSQVETTIYLYHSLGGKYGADFYSLWDIPYRNSPEFDVSMQLYTGLLILPLMPSRDIFNRCICFEHSDPLSFNILSVVQDVEVSDG